MCDAVGCCAVLQMNAVAQNLFNFIAVLDLASSEGLALAAAMTDVIADEYPVRVGLLPALPPGDSSVPSKQPPTGWQKHRWSTTLPAHGHTAASPQSQCAAVANAAGDIRPQDLNIPRVSDWSPSWCPNAGAGAAKWQDQSVSAQAAAAVAAMQGALGSAAAEMLVVRLAAAAVGSEEDVTPPPTKLTTLQASNVGFGLRHGASGEGGSSSSELASETVSSRNPARQG